MPNIDSRGGKPIRHALAAVTAPRPPQPKRKKRPELPVPDDLHAALKNNKKAGDTFRNFPPSHRREYIRWITDAKRPETRQKRLATTLEWLAEGKPHGRRSAKS